MGFAPTGKRRLFTAHAESGRFDALVQRRRLSAVRCNRLLDTVFWHLFAVSTKGVTNLALDRACPKKYSPHAAFTEMFV